MNSSDQAFMQDNLFLAMIEPEAFNDSKKYDKKDLDECDKDIRECSELLHYYILEDNNEEIAEWKRYLQQAKTRKRMIRKMIKTNITEKELITI